MMVIVFFMTVCLCTASAFVPVSKRVVSRSLQMGHLTGLPGSDSVEFGLKEFDPLKLSANEEWLPWFREAEIKHGRVAMLATAGFVFTEFVQLPGEVHQVSSVAAHSAAVTSGSLQQILFWTGLLEAICAPALADMKKTGREPGFYAFDPLGLSKDAKKAASMKTKEIKNGRLAMLAFSGIVTQSVLTGNGFPYLY